MAIFRFYCDFCSVSPGGVCVTGLVLVAVAGNYKSLINKSLCLVLYDLGGKINEVAAFK